MKYPGRPFYGISIRERLNEIWPNLINSGEMLKELTVFSDEELEKISTELNQLIIDKNTRKELLLLIERKLNA